MELACTERSRSVADVIKLLANQIEAIGLNSWQLRTLSAIKKCRTAALGGHVDACDDCGKLQINGNWQHIRADGKFLFHVKALSKVFRAKFCDKLKKENASQYQNIREYLWEKNWVVFAKRPFGSPKAVVEYLGRYTHKIAISNNRIKEIGKDTVSFTYKDYKQMAQKKEMTLSHAEFIRRFALHILPKGFVKIRHYGFLSSTWKRKKLKMLQEKMGIKPVLKEAEKTIILPKCPHCKTGSLRTILVFDKRGPPFFYMGDSQTSIPYKS